MPTTLYRPASDPVRPRAPSTNPERATPASASVPGAFRVCADCVATEDQSAVSPGHVDTPSGPEASHHDTLTSAGLVARPPFRVRCRILGRHARAIADLHTQSHFAASEAEQIAVRLSHCARPPSIVAVQVAWSGAPGSRAYS